MKLMVKSQEVHNVNLIVKIHKFVFLDIWMNFEILVTDKGEWDLFLLRLPDTAHLLA